MEIDQNIYEFRLDEKYESGYQKGCMDTIQNIHGGRSKKDLLVVKCNMVTSKENFQRLYDKIFDMKKAGVVLLPHYCETFLCPEDVTIEIETPNNLKEGLQPC